MKCCAGQVAARRNVSGQGHCAGKIPALIRGTHNYRYS